jgi:hypothetical protein
MIPCGWIISHRCSWITVYVLCCNAQMNLIMIFMTCTCIVMHSLFSQLPNCNLFTQHVISLWRGTSSELWTSVHSFTLIIPSTARTVYFLQALFTSPQTNIFFHIIRLILCFQQTGEIDNLTVSWGKVVWLCCVQVPFFCWRRGSHAPGRFLAPCQSYIATTFRSGFFLLLVN